MKRFSIIKKYPNKEELSQYFNYRLNVPFKINSGDSYFTYLKDPIIKTFKNDNKF